MSLARALWPTPEHALGQVAALQQRVAAMLFLAGTITAGVAPFAGVAYTAASVGFGLGAGALASLAVGLERRSRLAHALSVLLALVVAVGAPTLIVAYPTPLPRKLPGLLIMAAIFAGLGLLFLARPGVRAALGGRPRTPRPADMGFGPRTAAWCALFLGLVNAASWARWALVPVEWLPGNKPSVWTLLHIAGCVAMAGLGTFALHLYLRPRRVRRDVPFEVVTERARELRAAGHSRVHVAKVLEAENLPCFDERGWTAKAVRDLLGDRDPSAVEPGQPLAE